MEKRDCIKFNGICSAKEIINRVKKSQVWWHTAVIPAHGSPGQEAYEFEAILANLARPCLYKTKQNPK
jgi:hypothetical protein